MEEHIVDELKKQSKEVASNAVHEDLNWDSFNEQDDDDYVLQKGY